MAGKSARAEGDAAAAEDDNISVAIAQITVGRLVEENNPKPDYNQHRNRRACTFHTLSKILAAY